MSDRQTQLDHANTKLGASYSQTLLIGDRVWIPELKVPATISGVAVANVLRMYIVTLDPHIAYKHQAFDVPVTTFSLPPSELDLLEHVEDYQKKMPQPNADGTILLKGPQ
jgi:hypothetical protein